MHFDAHADTATECFGVALSHGTPMRRLLADGLVDPGRYVQIGLHGYWPGQDVLAWQRELGVREIHMSELARRGIGAVVEEAVAGLGEGPVFMTIDVDVLDPAFAPGTGTPEPGGMTSHDLLWACRALAERLQLVGAEVVEVCPAAVGTVDITALVASRIVHELATGVALRRAAAAHVPSAIR